MPDQRISQQQNLIKREKEDKRVFIDLSKEYEEDKELLELLDGKRKKLN